MNPTADLLRAAAQRSGPSMPDLQLFEADGQQELWQAALRQARRSPLPRYRMGAALWDPQRERLVSTGCAHAVGGRLAECNSLHAERHALRRARRADLAGSWCAVVSLNHSGTGMSWSAQPCVSCARALAQAGVGWVMYFQRQADGGWGVVRQRGEDLARSAAQVGIAGRYARLQRLPVAV